MLFSFGQAVSTFEIAGVVGILRTEFICLLRVSYCFIRSITCPKCFFESTLERVSISDEILSYLFLSRFVDRHFLSAPFFIFDHPMKYTRNFVACGLNAHA